jgi:WD40 repeat protein/TPR repeat protein
MKKILLLIVFQCTYFLGFTQNSNEFQFLAQLGHSSAITCLAVDPTGKYVASGGDDRVIKIWDIKRRKLVKVLPGHTGSVNSLTFNSKGNILVSGGGTSTGTKYAQGGETIVWEVPSGKILESNRRDKEEYINRITFVDISSSDNYIASACSSIGNIEIYNRIKETSIYLRNTGGYKKVKFTPDEKYLIGLDDKMIKVWNTSNWDSVAGFTLIEKISDFELHPNPKEPQILFCTKQDIYLWDILSGQIERKFTLNPSNEIDRLVELEVNPIGNELLVRAGKIFFLNMIDFTVDSTKSFITSSNGELGSKKWSEIKYSVDSELIVFGDGSNIRWVFPEESSTKVVFGIDDPNYTPGYSGFFGRSQEDIDVSPYVYFNESSRDNRYFVRWTGKNRYYDGWSGKLEIWDLKEGKPVREFENINAQISPDGQYLLIGTVLYDLNTWNKERIPFIAKKVTDKYARIIEIENNKKVDFSDKVSFSPDSKYLLTVLESDLVLISTKTSRIYKIFQENKEQFENSFFANHSLHEAFFSDDGNFIVCLFNQSSEGSTIVVWDIENKKISNQWNDLPLLKNLKISLDNKFIVCTSQKKPKTYFSRDYYLVNLLNTENGDIQEIVENRFEPEFNNFQFDPNSQYLLIEQQISEEYEYYMRLNVWSLKNDSLLWGTKHALVNNRNISLSQITPDGKHVLSSNNFNSFSLNLLNIENGKSDHIFQRHTAPVTAAYFSRDNSWLLTSAKDFKTVVWDYDTKKALFELASFDKNEFFVRNYQGYYMYSKNLSDKIGLSDGELAYDFDQFDVIYNRPDLVLKSLGFASTETINTYYNAFQKRIEKTGISEDVLNLKGTPPNIKFIDSDLPLVTQEDTISISVMAYDENYVINKLNVWVNNVPLYGRNGIDLKNNKEKELKRLVKIPLSVGNNKIQISSTNNIGLESFKETLNVNKATSSSTNKLIVVAIGASKYRSSNLDLKYAAKDAKDIISFFKKDRDNVITYSLIDEQVNLDSVRALKEILQKTRVDDKVVLYFAGHGFLDEDLNYYLGTYDIDSQKPSEQGLPYEEFEALLDGIPARQKLILIDACHSGEVDKDNTELSVAADSDKTRGIRTYSRGVKPVNYKSNLSLENSFTLMKELFADVRRGTGATVISSAGGAEYAYEGPDWQNGVFTYCLLQGLSEMKADADENEIITVSELQQFVADEVPSITKGMQQPTYRIENISNDWTVWKINSQNNQAKKARSTATPPNSSTRANKIQNNQAQKARSTTTKIYNPAKADEMRKQAIKYYIGNPKVDYEKAVELFETAKELELSGLSAMWVAKFNHSEMQKDSAMNIASKVIPKIKSLAKSGHAEAQYLLGYAYFYGVGIEQNTARGFKLFEEACRQNNSMGCLACGHTFHNSGVYRGAFMYYIRAEMLGNIYATTLLGWLYAKGKFVKEDVSLAKEKFLEAYNKGDVDAALGLAYIYDLEESNYEKAAKLYMENITVTNSSYAVWRLGRLYASGKIGLLNENSIDKDLAITYLNSACEDDYRQACKDYETFLRVFSSSKSFKPSDLPAFWHDIEDELYNKPYSYVKSPRK